MQSLRKCTLLLVSTHCHIQHWRPSVIPSLWIQSAREAAYYRDQHRTPRITIPQKMAKKVYKDMERKNRQEIERRKNKSRGFGQVIIACRRKRHNHHINQKYSDFNPQKLASYGWKNYKATGDHFTIFGGRPNPALQKSDPETKVEDFTSFKLNPELMSALDAMNIHEPTRVQAVTIPDMLRGSNVICSSETGSGKTLAYLLPILHMLREKKLPNYMLPNCPRCVILVPSRELAVQVGNVANLITQFTRQAVRVATGTSGHKILERGKVIDVLVSTPGMLQVLMKTGQYDLSAVEHVVLDEGDTLLDDSFFPLVKSLLRWMQFGPSDPMANQPDANIVKTQLAVIGATLPRELENVFEQLAPRQSFKKVTTAFLHRLMPHVPQKFLKIKANQKPGELLKICQKNNKLNIPTIIFVNKMDTIYFLHRFLNENGIQHATMSREYAGRERTAQFRKFQSGECNILLCTDVGSRGLDTTMAQHIVNYEFPDFISDYIHRVGRVGRVSSKVQGYVVNFITFKWDVELVWKIESAVRQIQEFDKVDANIKKKLKERKGSDKLM